MSIKWKGKIKLFLSLKNFIFSREALMNLPLSVTILGDIFFLETVNLKDKFIWKVLIISVRNFEHSQVFSFWCAFIFFPQEKFNKIYHARIFLIFKSYDWQNLLLKNRFPTSQENKTTQIRREFFFFLVILFFIFKKRLSNTFPFNILFLSFT